MKKKTLYAALLLVFISTAGFVIIQFRGEENAKKNAVYQLLDRNSVLAKTDEWSTTQKNAASLLAAIKANPQDVRSRVRLANLFIMEGRATGNYQYYDKAAMKYVNDALTIEPG